MSLTADEVRALLLLERERRVRIRRKEEEPKYDWYGPPCGCPETRVDPLGRATCPIHHRARENQRPPDDPDWLVWLILAGRGFGKTRCGVEWIIDRARNGPKGGRYALVGHTKKDSRETMVEGESGVLAKSPPWFMPRYNVTHGTLTWPNGAKAFCYSAEEPGQLRGPQFHDAWCDELAKWSYVEECWSNLKLALRLGANEGHVPRIVVTTTPLPLKIIKRLMADARTRVTRGSTFDNVANLPQSAVEDFERQWGGTRLGRQELGGEVLEDVPGALWSPKLIEDARRDVVPDLIRLVVGVDPVGSSATKKQANAYDEERRPEAGIVVAGRCEDDHYWILDDLSMTGSPEEWASAAVAAYHRWGCDRLAAEANFGGDMVEATIRNVDEDVAFKKLWASRGKVVRAEPITALYEKGRVHHVGVFPELENQMCSYVPGMPSPDRMDALVWAITELQDSAPGHWGPGVIPSSWRG